MSNYYKHSGKIAPNSILFLLVSCLVIFPLMAIAYTYLIWYIPIIYINIVVTAGFGFGVGLVINFLVVKHGKVRSPIIASLFALIGSLVALYFSWAVWVDLVINSGESYGNSRIGITASNIQLSQLFDLILNPNLVKNLALEINQYGTWGIKATTVSGTALFAIWAIEALIVIVISMFICYLRAKKPFCEFENKWFEETLLPAFNLIENPHELISNLSNQNKESFEGLTLVTQPDSESHSVFTLYSSNSGKNYLSIENKQKKINRKGEIEFDSNEFIEDISVDGIMKEGLMKKAEGK